MNSTSDVPKYDKITDFRTGVPYLLLFTAPWATWMAFHFVGHRANHNLRDIAAARRVFMGTANSEDRVIVYDIWRHHPPSLFAFRIAYLIASTHLSKQRRRQAKENMQRMKELASRNSDWEMRRIESRAEEQAERERNHEAEDAVLSPVDSNEHRDVSQQRSQHSSGRSGRSERSSSHSRRAGWLNKIRNWARRRMARPTHRFEEDHEMTQFPPAESSLPLVPPSPSLREGANARNQAPGQYLQVPQEYLSVPGRRSRAESSGSSRSRSRWGRILRIPGSHGSDSSGSRRDGHSRRKSFSGFAATGHTL